MDVHSTNYTLCAMEPVVGAEDRIFGEIQVAPDYKEVICFIEAVKLKLGLDNDYSVECGYEAGCLGYSLYHQLTRAGIHCVILAPSTMLSQQGNRIKTDRRDARLIAQCLCYGGYHSVYIPTGEDHKSKELRSRQKGQSSELIAYADKANTRLRSKYYKMIRRGKKKNVAVAAVARELACFIWGMMTGNETISLLVTNPRITEWLNAGNC